MAYDNTETPIEIVDPKTLTDPKDRLNYLINFIRGIPKNSFNMACWIVDSENAECGTVACIGGWINKLFTNDSVGKINRDFLSGNGDVEMETGKLIGIRGREKAHALFYPMTAGLSWSDIQPHEAADVLQHLKDTGEVDWSIIHKD